MSSQLVAFLEGHADEIVEAANQALGRAHLHHYEAAGANVAKAHLKRLFELTVESARKKSLSPIISWSENAARERFNAGFDLYEVQTAFNVLEETIWRRIIKELNSNELAEAIGLVSTILGAAKDNLARTYVSLASQRRVPSLDLRELFEGAER